MAIAFGAALGTCVDAGATNPYTLSTGAVVPSGALVICATWLGADTAPVGTVSGGGLTWTRDVVQIGTDGTPDWELAVWSAPAPSGLASGTTISLNHTQTTYSGLMSCFYVTGVDTGASRVDMTDSQFRTAPNTSWSSTASSTTTADTILIGVGAADHSNTTMTSTPTGSATEIHDTKSTDGIYITTTYRIVAATGSYGATGTWSQTPGATDAAAVVAYKIASAATAAFPFSPPLRRRIHRNNR